MTLFVTLLSHAPRRRLARRYLHSHEIPLTVTSFPRLGASGVFTDPYFDPVDAVASHSLFLPQEITNPHARFPCVNLHSFYPFSFDCQPAP